MSKTIKIAIFYQRHASGDGPDEKEASNVTKLTMKNVDNSKFGSFMWIQNGSAWLNR